VNDYLSAACRKIEIAQYHLNKLRELSPGVPTLVVPIPVQAHFEGILIAFIAASDQVAEAIAQGLHLGNVQNLGEALKRSKRTGSPWDDLRRWNDAVISLDVRAIRRLAVHHHYIKAHGILEAAPGRPDYGGSRELIPYGEAVSAHLDALKTLLESLSDSVHR
jgi:hypothetical protein